MLPFRDESEVVMHSNDPIAPVGYLKLNKLHLETKLPPLDLISRMANLPLKDSDGYITDEGEEAMEKNNDENVHDEESNDINNVSNNKEIEYSTSNENAYIKTAVNFGKSGFGWLWIGSIQGNAEDPIEAIKQAMENLKCRYALPLIIIKLLNNFKIENHKLLNSNCLSILEKID